MSSRHSAQCTHIGQVISDEKSGGGNFESRPIPGFPGYEATNDGRILHRHWDRSRPVHEMKLIPEKRRGGVLRVQIVNAECKRFTSRVHRLIALAFHGEPKEPAVFARHIDDNPLNNQPSNIAWATSSLGPICQELSSARLIAKLKREKKKFDWLTRVSRRANAKNRLQELRNQRNRIVSWLAVNPESHPLHRNAELTLDSVNREIETREAVQAGGPMVVIEKARAA